MQTPRSGVLAHRLRLLRIIAEREKRAQEHDPPLPAPQQEWFSEQQRRTIRQAMELGFIADSDGVRLTDEGKRFLDIFRAKRRRRISSNDDACPSITFQIATGVGGAAKSKRARSNAVLTLAGYSRKAP